MAGSRRRRYQCANLHRFWTEEKVVGRFSSHTEKDAALSTPPRVNPRIDKLLK
jgi:hypothetical protein